MTDILQIFSGNPLTTFIGKKIEAATRADLESDDWALNLEICDIINENDDDAKDAVRAIRKRLQIEHDPDFIVTNRTLTVLETCVSNCSHRFHVLVMTKDFIQDLVKLIGPKNKPPTDLQERVLRMIERWADAFRQQPELSGVVSVYNELKTKGVTFPSSDPSMNVPIQTPQRSVPPPASPARAAPTLPTQRSMPSAQLPTGQAYLEGDGFAKVSQDLSVVQSSIEMFNDVLKVLESAQSDESDWALASDMHSTCLRMKERIIDLIERVGNEDLTMEMLKLNDELINLFARYESLLVDRSKSLTESQERSRSAGCRDGPARIESTEQRGQTSSVRSGASASNKPAGVSSGTLNDLSLIDFNAANSGSEPKQSSQQQKSTLVDADPFDTSNIPIASDIQDSQPQLTAGMSAMHIDNKSSSVSKNKPLSGLPEEISSVRTEDFAEIESWLKTDAGKEASSLQAAGGGDSTSNEPISIPNSEFENFIATRALAGGSSSAFTAGSGATKQPVSRKKPEPYV